MFSIGEFARLGGVSVRTLRHYDEIGLLRPARVDQDTGYRGYTADQLGQLNRVMALKELGLSLTQARRLLDGITLDELHGMLILRRAHEGITVYLAQPVTEPPGELPEPARYRVLPEIEAAAAVRSGPAVSIFPVVYHDLVRWIDERGYRAVIGSNREVWVNEVDDIADVAQQVFEIQLPFTRPGPQAAD
jgi:DNA-binding transcriptional MerR regulator